MPATADAAVRHVIKGAGFGHGIGMSQYGAYGYALEGSSYQGILAHYYKGTRLSTAPERPVRVLLQPSDPYIRVRGATRGRRPLAASRARTYVARALGRRRSLITDVVGQARGARSARPLASARRGDPCGCSAPRSTASATASTAARSSCAPTAAGVTAINVLDLDPYVRGVVAGEMPSSWPLEALKVQAVAARTYALATRKTTGTFDQYPDTRSQVYRGVTGESVRSDAAVTRHRGPHPHLRRRAGRDLLLLHLGRPHRERRVLVHRRALKPWLVGVPDPYDTRSPYHRWQAHLLRRHARPGAGRAGHASSG